MAKDKTSIDPPTDDATAVLVKPIDSPTDDAPVAPVGTVTVKARVLSDCAYGLQGDVIEIDAALAAACLLLDADPSAVAYAESMLAAKAE